MPVDGPGGCLPFPSGQGQTWFWGELEAYLVFCPLVATVSLSRKGPEPTPRREGSSG